MEYPKRRRTDAPAAGYLGRRFGSIAVHKGFVTGDQVKTALAEQVEDNMLGREHRMLGAILFDHGWITEQQIEDVLVVLRTVL